MAVQACGQALQWRQGLALLEGRATSFACCAQLTACGRATAWLQALQLLAEMPRREVEANQVCWETQGRCLWASYESM